MKRQRRSAMRLVSSILLMVSIYSTGVPQSNPPQQNNHQQPPPRPELFARQNGAGIFLELGKPSVWSLAQAHYLLAQMRENAKNIKTKDLGELDPNTANGSRVKILRQIFGAHVQYDQAAGLKNQMAAEQYNREVSQQQAAITRLGQLLEDRRDLVTQQKRLIERIVVNEERLKVLNAKPNLTDAEKAEKASLEELIAQQKGQQARLEKAMAGLDEEIDIAKTDAGKTPSAPTFTSLFQQPAQPLFELPDSTGVIDKFMDPTKVPSSLDAHTQLENTIQMQYEIIAKQLTLLRDEVGANQRLIFLELPSSIYTTPKESKNYLVQVEWRVNRYLRKRRPKARKQSGEDQAERLADGASRDGETPSQTDDADDSNRPPLTLSSVQELGNVREEVLQPLRKASMTYGDSAIIQIRKSLQELNDYRAAKRIELSDTKKAEIDRKIAGLKDRLSRFEAASLTDLTPEEIERLFPYLENPDLLSLEWRDVPVSTSSPEFRTVDIIPRQTALNVNDTYNKTVGLNLQGAFQWITGIGAKVGYQRQKELYEQFLQQEIYASGYGKGSDRFGWTFAPLPGTDRIAPGVRTTYAVMVVPSEAMFIELRGRAYVHRRNHMPTGDPERDEEKTFVLAVPAEETERFQVTGITYTPVLAGAKATVILTGENFSPQTHILVNGARLARVTSIGESDGPAEQGSAHIGVFEYLNPNEIVMSFSISNFVGTPIITLVTPEKTSPINFFPNLSINYGRPNQSLYETSRRFPMFLDPLSLGAVQAEPIVQDNELIVHLLGKGFLRGANITINGVIIPRSALEHISTSQYRITLDRILLERITQSATANDTSGKPLWKVHYRHHTKQNFAESESSLPLQTVPNDYAVLDYVRGANGQAEATLLVNSTASGPVTVSSRHIISATVNRTSPLEIRLVFNNSLPAFPIEITDNMNNKRTLLFKVPDAPAISNVANVETGRNEGPADDPHLVKIEGKFLQHVVQVRFNSADAEILDVSPALILVRTPSMEGAARVFLKTDLVLNDRAVTNIDDLKTPNKGKYVFKRAKKPAGQRRR